MERLDIEASCYNCKHSHISQMDEKNCSVKGTNYILFHLCRDWKPTAKDIDRWMQRKAEKEISGCSSVLVGRTHYYVHGGPRGVRAILKTHKTRVMGVEASNINPYNGIIKVWKLGELIDKITKEAQDE